MNVSRNRVTPKRSTAEAKKRPDIIRPTPQTKSWLSEDVRVDRPTGCPAATRHADHDDGAAAGMPMSCSTRVASSIMEIRLEIAAKKSATKKMIMKNCRRACARRAAAPR
jgi:hypothetical protein